MWFAVLLGAYFIFFKHKNCTNTVIIFENQNSIRFQPPSPSTTPRQLKCHKTHHSNSVVWWHKSHPIQRRAYPLTHVTGRFCSMCVTTICQLKERPHVSDNRLSLRQTPTHHAVPNERPYLLLHITKSPFYRHLYLHVRNLAPLKLPALVPRGSERRICDHALPTLGKTICMCVRSHASRNGTQ